MDDETGYYYYGARYYNPRVSLWLNVDPLASYDPMMNSEHYIDGQHNGGVYNSGNLNPYIYTYQNPIIYIDPDGKQSKVTDMGMGFLFPPANGNTPLGQIQRNLLVQKTLLAGAAASSAVAADIYSGGTLDKLFLAYNAGNAYHSMEMQSYWRYRGNEGAAKKYEQEGADATSSLSLYAGGSLVGGGIRYLRNAIRPGLTYGEKIGIIRIALQEKGNFGLGAATEKEALQLGRDFVGKG